MKIFDSIKINRPRSNVFDLSHERKMSMQMGHLVPMLVQEVVPGDKFKVNSEMLIRLAPMLAPVMHRVNVYTHFFFVPNRLVYDDWGKFITGGEDGLQVPAFPLITIDNDNKGSAVKGSLADYMGIPIVPSGVTVTNNMQFSALPFRAYHLIYNEYYRDQNLSNPVPITKDGTVSGPELAELLTLRTRAWEKDYFTAALPWAQRGGAVAIPNNSIVYKNPATSNKVTGAMAASANQITVAGEAATIENIDSIGIGVNDLRRSLRLQEWLEKNARGGSRYVEQLLSHFGVRSSDARIQRPEYLGGGKSPIVISEVLSSVKTSENPQGNMAGHGIGVGNTNSFYKFFEEHGWIIGIVSILPKTAYQQGIDRSFLKTDKLDYYFPEFANIGEQTIQNRELYVSWDGANVNLNPFGYQSRYAEYKFKQSSVHGDFRDNLAFWHMGRIFSSAPSLNESFVKSSPTQRIFAVTDETVHKVYIQLYNSVKAVRPMPYYGTPSI